MRIGWIICTGGIFGSVREVIENSNVLVKLGHDVTIYTPDGVNQNWLPYLGKFAKLPDCIDAGLDCLFFANIPEEPFFSTFEKADAKIKGFVQMGFPEHMLHSEPTEFLTKKHQYMIDNYWALADGWWQVEYARKFQPNAGPSIGGINLKMFRPVESKKTHDIIWTGDRRQRKGGDTVLMATHGMTRIQYHGKSIPQMELSEYMNRGRVFVDGHLHGGWCNPVVEAMASGVPVVCTKIPCTSEFAIHEQTALVVNAHDHAAMRTEVLRLLKDHDLRETLRANALEHIRQFDYEIVGLRLEQAIIERL